MKEVRILLLGKTNYENRIVTNMLMKRDHRSDDEVLKEPQTYEVDFLKHSIKFFVTDTPGLQDSDIPLADVKRNIEYSLKGRKYISGFHAVLLVYR